MKNQNHLKVAMLVAVTAFMLSCKKDKPELNLPYPGLGPKLFIVNEGQFQAGNGSVSAYGTQTKKVDPDFYATQNGGAKIGDIAQSMIRHNNEYFIVVNNSGKIVVCDESLKKKGEITGITSPRYIQPIGGDEAYVSGNYAGIVTRVNLANRSILGQINVPGTTETFAMLGNDVFVCNSSNGFLYRIDATHHKVTDSIDAGAGASWVVLDKHNKLWVLGYGDFTGGPGYLKCIDPSTWKVERTMEMPATAFASRLCLNPGRDTLYYLANGIQRMPVTATTLPATPFVPAGTMALYALEVNPKTYHVYAADVIDYVQKSSILVYDAAGTKVTEFKAGVVSTDFFFE